MTIAETTVQQPPAPIPAPPNFPVAWERPTDAQMFWTTDPLHFPDPMHPLEYVFMEHAIGRGFNLAAASYELPIGMHSRRLNTYYYQSIMPLMLPPEELEMMGRRSEERLGAAMARLAERWTGEQLPELQRYLDDWRSFDLRSAALPQLLSHLDQTIARTERAWEIHFQIVIPMLLAMSMFQDLYRDLFGDGQALEAYRLLRGFDNKSLEADRGLWRLSHSAAAPEVRGILETRAASDVIPALERSDAGRAFLAELRAYLDEYGRRSDKWAIIGVPGWIEDPTPVIKNVKDYLTRPDHDPLAEMAALAAEREQLLARARERLQGYPAPVVGQFEFLLKAAQAATALQEDHNYWIDQRWMYEVRLVTQEFGRRFAAAGVIAQPDDIAYLDIEELHATAEALPRIQRHTLVAARKAAMEHFRTIAPPPALGTLPPGAPPDNPVNRAIERFFGGQPQTMAAPGVLRGNVGSPGKVRGIAKVVRSLAEAGKLERDNILVAETTAPPWTPLFATVAAVVTDTGGILSHCAVVAREYGIPAVVGVGVATSTIRDGQVIEVDGDTGVVRIIEDEV